MRQQRRLSAVPAPVIALLAAGLALQVTWHALQPPPRAQQVALRPAPPAALLRLGALGDALLAAKLTMLWLQAFDNQPGISIPFRELDYARLETWLERILELDPKGQYPLLAASRLYAEVPDGDKQKRMLELVYRHFLLEPDTRWPWLAHAAILARHRLGDLQLALKYARAITDQASGEDVPFWARDMSILLLEDMGELEAARILVGGLIRSGRITDPNELRFLHRKLAALESRNDEISTTR